jgi:hypothetical protein
MMGAMERALAFFDGRKNLKGPISPALVAEFLGGAKGADRESAEHFLDILLLGGDLTEEAASSGKLK